MKLSTATRLVGGSPSMWNHILASQGMICDRSRVDVAVSYAGSHDMGHAAGSASTFGGRLLHSSGVPSDRQNPHYPATRVSYQQQSQYPPPALMPDQDNLISQPPAGAAAYMAPGQTRIQPGYAQAYPGQAPARGVRTAQMHAEDLRVDASSYLPASGNQVEWSLHSTSDGSMSLE